jgi:hypothetical protein
MTVSATYSAATRPSFVSSVPRAQWDSHSVNPRAKASGVRA